MNVESRNQLLYPRAGCRLPVSGESASSPASYRNEVFAGISVLLFDDFDGTQDHINKTPEGVARHEFAVAGAIS